MKILHRVQFFHGHRTGTGEDDHWFLGKIQMLEWDVLEWDTHVLEWDTHAQHTEMNGNQMWVSHC